MHGMNLMSDFAPQIHGHSWAKPIFFISRSLIFSSSCKPFVWIVNGRNGQSARMYGWMQELNIHRSIALGLFYDTYSSAREGDLLNTLCFVLYAGSLRMLFGCRMRNTSRQGLGETIGSSGFVPRHQHRQFCMNLLKTQCIKF